MTRILPPRRTYRRSGYFKAGELARLWLDELRKADGTALATAATAHNILDAKELPHDPDLVTTVADRVQSYLRDRAARRCRQNGQAPRCSMGACAIFDMIRSAHATAITSFEDRRPG